MGEEELRVAGVTMFCCWLLHDQYPTVWARSKRLAVAISCFNTNNFSLPSLSSLLLDPLSFTFVVGFVMGFATYD